MKKNLKKCKITVKLIAFASEDPCIDACEGSVRPAWAKARWATPSETGKPTRDPGESLREMSPVPRE